MDVAETNAPESLVYFAYGSNMLTARLRARTPSCVPIGIGTLTDHTLRFHKRSKDGSGKCNALAEVGGEGVIGVLYNLNPAERAKLDRAEGVGGGYDHAMVTVVDHQGQSHIVLTYLAHPDHVDDGLRPYGWYKALVLAGAKEHGLPTNYVAAQIEPVEADDDADFGRDARERAALAADRAV